MRLLVPTVLLALAACTGPAATVTPTPSTTEAAPEPSVVAQTEAPPTLPPSANRAFGATFSWDDGVSVTISKPRTYSPGPDVAFQDKTSTTFLIMDVVLKNGSTEPRQASLLHVRAMTGTREAMQVMDRDSGVTTSNEMIAPGAEYRGKIAFGVDAGQPFVLTAHFEFDRGGVIYKDEG